MTSRAYLRHLFVLLAVMRVFVRETAEQPPAHPADLIRVERQLLVLRHANADRRKLAQPACAALLSPPALAYAIEQFGPSLMPIWRISMRERCACRSRTRSRETTLLGREIDQQATAVETVFATHDLDVQAAGARSYRADAHASCSLRSQRSCTRSQAVAPLHRLDLAHDFRSRRSCAAGRPPAPPPARAISTIT